MPSASPPPFRPCLGNMSWIFFVNYLQTPMPEQKSAKWYVDLATSANSLGEELGLDEHGTQKLRDLLINKGKEQFLAGNRSGIKWARTNPSPARAVAA